MQKKENALCFSGHRSEKLSNTEGKMETLKLRLWEEIERAIENGIDTLYFGACYGFDLLCADIVAKRKRVIKTRDPKIIKLIAVTPFENQAIRWKESDRELYYDTLPHCDEVITLNNTTQFVYDGRANLVKEIDALGGTTAYYYDIAGKVTAVVSPNSYKANTELSQMNRTEYTYNAMDKMVTQSCCMRRYNEV